MFSATIFAMVEPLGLLALALRELGRGIEDIPISRSDNSDLVFLRGRAEGSHVSSLGEW